MIDNFPAQNADSHCIFDIHISRCLSRGAEIILDNEQADWEMPAIYYSFNNAH